MDEASEEVLKLLSTVELGGDVDPVRAFVLMQRSRPGFNLAIASAELKFTVGIALDVIGELDLDQDFVDKVKESAVLFTEHVRADHLRLAARVDFALVEEIESAAPHPLGTYRDHPYLSLIFFASLAYMFLAIRKYMRAVDDMRQLQSSLWIPESITDIIVSSFTARDLLEQISSLNPLSIASSVATMSVHLVSGGSEMLGIGEGAVLKADLILSGSAKMIVRAFRMLAVFASPIHIILLRRLGESVHGFLTRVFLVVRNRVRVVLEGEEDDDGTFLEPSPLQGDAMPPLEPRVARIRGRSPVRVIKSESKFVVASARAAYKKAHGRDAESDAVAIDYAS